MPSSKYASSMAKMVPLIVQNAIQLHMRVAAMFLPTAVKFHYTFNVRDFANVFQASWKGLTIY